MSDALRPGSVPDALAAPRGASLAGRLRVALSDRAALVAGLCLGMLLVVASFAGPWLYGVDPYALDPAHVLARPGSAFPLGTDELGRDALARLLAGGASTLEVSLPAALLAFVVGTLYGLASGLGPSWLDSVLMRLLDAVLALPGLVVLIFFASLVRLSDSSLVLLLGLISWPGLARLVRNEALAQRNRDFVLAARQLGGSPWYVARVHLLRVMAPLLVVNGTLLVGDLIFALSALSFLGLGVRAPEYDWGNLLNEGLRGIYTNPMGALGPGLFVVLGGLSFALLGESLTSLAKRVPSLKGQGGASSRRRRDQRPAAAVPGDPALVLQAQGLSVTFPAIDGSRLTAVDGVTFSMLRGETVGIVGESGSGKTLTALGLSQLVSYPGVVDWRVMRINDQDLATASSERQRRLLGASLALVSQDPMTALNPALRVGGQLAEVARVHLGQSRARARELAVQRLDDVLISEPARRAHQFPYEFSGGMRQRAVIAMGLMGDPQLIVADEPTTALDVTVQKQVLQLLSDLNTQTGAALLLISHDIAVVSNVCTRILVMYGGRIVEDASSSQLLADAAHPYARALIAAVPSMTSDRDADLATIPGRPPTLAEIPLGCPFAARCAHADDRCRAEMPPLADLHPGWRVACWHPQSEHGVGVLQDVATGTADA